jgi:hypothetical protein
MFFRVVVRFHVNSRHVRSENWRTPFDLTTGSSTRSELKMIDSSFSISTELAKMDKISADEMNR